MSFANAKQRFSDRVTDYVRYRPGYPLALYDVLASECGLRPEPPIADIGSGTGLLSKLFLDRGNPVFGVEPNPEMRAAGEEFLRNYPNFTSVDGSAETTALANASVHFATAAQAFHWFDPQATRREFQRILKPGGFVVVVWNDRVLSESAFARQYEDLLRRFSTDYTRVRETYPEAEAMQQFFGANHLRHRELPNFQDFDFRGLAGRLRSSSYAPKEGHPNYEPMMSQLQNIFDENEVDGRVRMVYTTHLYFAQLER
ncbi:MAG TPA: class I SAM-dependent methyltransferase [Candidatus Sulfotelmatobacter sp.]|nr:class I SAM-dependent methyltransferase [Candidatus Sulfotelmatobacter sp.]